MVAPASSIAAKMVFLIIVFVFLHAAPPCRECRMNIRVLYFSFRTVQEQPHDLQALYRGARGAFHWLLRMQNYVKTHKSTSVFPINRGLREREGAKCHGNGCQTDDLSATGDDKPSGKLNAAFNMFKSSR